MWVWGEMEKLDTVMYIHSKIFNFRMVVLVGSLVVPGLMSRSSFVTVIIFSSDFQEKKKNVMVMEVLSKLLDRAVEGQYLSGFCFDK